MIVLDTSVIYALADAADRRHREAVAWYEATTDELVTTPLVLAEADHLIGARGTPAALRAFRTDVRSGAYLVEWWSSAAAEATEIADRHTDLGLGLTDASLVALAARVGSIAIATFDERHFRAVTPIAGGPAFRLLPLDATG